MTDHDRIRMERAERCDHNNLESVRDAVRGLQSTDDPSLLPLHDQLMARLRELEPLTKPLTAEEVHARQDAEGYIKAVIAVDLSALIDSDIEDVNDLAEEAIVDSKFYLVDISYRVVGAIPATEQPNCCGGQVLIEVRALIELHDAEELQYGIEDEEISS